MCIYIYIQRRACSFWVTVHVVVVQESLGRPRTPPPGSSECVRLKGNDVEATVWIEIRKDTEEKALSLREQRGILEMSSVSQPASLSTGCW